MFEKLTVAPPDPVFGLAEAFRNDKNPRKINLTVGAYQTEDGLTPVLDCVKRAEEKILAHEKTKNYLPIEGETVYGDLIARLVLGDSSSIVEDRRYATAHTPGGTAALRIAADLLRINCQTKTIWVCDPTWANHPQIFASAGMKVEWYPYLTPDRKALGFDAMMSALSGAAAGDAILLHTVCHNPTGFDLNREQWLEVLSLVEKRRLIPIFDFAYQGFGESVNADAWPIREFVGRGHEALICNSFSKNMGLYGERVGGLTVVVADRAAHAATLSQMKSIIRTLYSTPPQHGGVIAKSILADETLRTHWLEELEMMRLRIKLLRTNFAAKLRERIPDHDFSFINQQLGMFSFSGLSREQVIRLRQEDAIYAVESGRINIAGINTRNLEQICDAIARCVEQAAGC
ncbi:MAG: amino acid aminotransferase [Pirellulaceae bacterium]